MQDAYGGAWGVRAVGWTPLHLACWERRAEIATLLLEHGADPDRVAGHGWTSLHLAARRGHIDVVKLLLRYGAGVDTDLDNHETPLEAASYCGAAEVVALLLEHGGKPNQSRPNGRSPLIAAAIGGHAQVVKVLLRVGADRTWRDKMLWTARMHAAWNGRQTVAEVLAGSPSASLVDVATGSDKQAINQYLREGTPVDQTEPGGWTALFWAALAGQVEMVRVLLSAGADPNYRAVGLTPFTAAVSRNRLAVLEPLLAGGAASDEALVGAASRGKTKVIAWLLAHGVQATADALTAAAFAGNIELVKQFLSSGVHVDSLDAHGSTALHCAAYAGKDALVKVLLDCGATQSRKDAEGRTPLDYARVEGWDECIALLQAAS